MILYTMMPEEMIFPVENHENASPQMLNYNGVPVLAEQSEGGSYHIVRILSTDPSHFLNPDCAPGTKISFV
jgi:hypothetical protein